MIPTNFQKAEIRDSNDNIIQQGAYGKNSALSNATNDGWIDYVMNNLEALKGESDQAATVEYVDETLTNYATLESPALTGTPTAPTPTAGDDSTKVATTAFVQDAIDDANGYTDTEIATAVAAEVTRSDGAYLPFTGGTITGNLSVNGTLTGNLTGNVTGDVTGDLTGNADTATNATNDANGNPITSTYLPLAGGTLTGAVNGVTPTAGDDSTKVATTAYVQEELRQHASMPIGHEYFTMNPNVPQGSLPLFGGEYSRATYADLWAWVQTQTGYLKTEADWQDLSTANNGNVPYYSSGDGSTTFRVPSLKCWVKGANGTVTEVGSYLEAGLPNITGSFLWREAQSTSPMGGFEGAFSSDGYVGTQTMNLLQQSTDSGYRYKNTKLNASRSSSVYGNSTTVQPESIVGMWLVKAYGTIEDTGVIDEQQYIDDRIAAEVTRSDGKYLPLAGGTMSGAIHYNGANNRSFGFDLTANNTNMDIGWNWTNRDGAGFGLRSTDDISNTPGSFSIYARDGSNSTALDGYPNGSLTWAGKHVERVNSSGTNYIRYENGLQIVFDRISVSMSGAESTGAPASYTYYKYRKAVYYNLPATFVDNNNVAFAI